MRTLIFLACFLALSNPIVSAQQYDLVIDPQVGTGFPRFVQRRSIPAGTADLGDFQIGPPARLQFHLREPNQITSPILNPIAHAMVRNEPDDRAEPVQAPE